MSNKEKITVIKAALRTYTRMNKKIRKALESTGIEITHSRAHYMLSVRNEVNDTRKLFVLSATSSDWRTGRNLSSEIASFLLK